MEKTIKNKEKKLHQSFSIRFKKKDSQKIFLYEGRELKNDKIGEIVEDSFSISYKCYEPVRVEELNSFISSINK